MAPDSPPQPVAQLFAVSANGKFDHLADMKGFAGDGAAVQLEEPATAATSRSGDLLIRILLDGRIRMAYLSKVDVGGEVGSDDGGGSGSTDQTDDEDVGGSSGTDPEEQAEPKDEAEWGSTDTEDEAGKARYSQSSSSSCSSNSVMEYGDKELKEKRHHLQIRLWPQYCVLVLFEDECWKVTKQLPVQWLQQDQFEEINQSIIIENERIELVETKNLDFVDLSKQMCVLGFIGLLESSEAVENFLGRDLSPDIMNYDIDLVLGTGVSCKVYGVDAQYAIKNMKLTKKFDDVDALAYKEPREVIILSSFKRSVVVGFFHAWAAPGIYKSCLKGSSDSEKEDSNDVDSESDDELEGTRYVAIQMEYCGSTLSEFLESANLVNGVIDVKKSWFIFKELVKGVQFIHSSGVIHRDLKPKNIFFGYDDTNTIKIGDFGHACWAKQYAAGEPGTPNRGTAMYCAPELQESSSPTACEPNAETTPTVKADIYSIGTIFLELFHLFGSEHEKYEVFNNLRDGEYPNSVHWHGDNTLLKKLTAFNPSERPSADEILEYISNCF